MTRKILLRPQAETDLTAIWDYSVRAWSTDQAQRYLSELAKMLGTLAEFPEMARLRTEFVPALRIHRFRKHVIVYDFTETTLEVIRILHGRAHWTAFLSE